MTSPPSAQQKNLKRRYLIRYGLEFGRTVFATDANRGMFEVISTKEKVTLTPGGSVTNSIRVLKWMNRDSQVPVGMIGCVGDDNYGRILTNELNDNNINTFFEVNQALSTSRCGSAIYKKERCLLPEIKASRALSDDYIQANLEAILEKCDTLFIEGYFLAENVDLLAKLAILVNENGGKIALTLSATFIIENFYEATKRMSDLADIIFCNEDEAATFSGLSREDPIEKLALALHQKLSEKEGRILVITNGCKPTHVSQYSVDSGELINDISVPTEKVSSEEIEDTNGCGDG